MIKTVTIKLNIDRDDVTILDLLLEEANYKKDYTASYNSTCDCCGGNIGEGDPLYFTGNKAKMCEGCHDKLINLLEVINEQVK